MAAQTTAYRCRYLLLTDRTTQKPLYSAPIDYDETHHCKFIVHHRHASQFAGNRQSESAIQHRREGETAFCSERIIEWWNNLDEDTVSANTLNCFKRRLQKWTDKDEFTFRRDVR